MFWRSRGLSEAHERGALGRHERLFADATTLLALDSGDTPQARTSLLAGLPVELLSRKHGRSLEKRRPDAE
jgi:hypothetical protein